MSIGEISPGHFEVDIDEILQFSPPIPHGRADISDLEQEARSRGLLDPTHAWERLPLWLARVEETYKNIGSIPILTLDIGSSVPLYTQYLRTYEFMRDGVRARELVASSFNEGAFNSIRGNQHGFLRSLHAAVSKNAVARDLAATTIQEYLYGVIHTDVETIQQELFTRLIGQKHIYTEQRERKGAAGKNGIRINKLEQGQTYLEAVSGLTLPTIVSFDAGQRLIEDPYSEEDRQNVKNMRPAGEVLAAVYSLWQARHFARAIKRDGTRFRPARFMSFDSSDPKEIAIRNLVSMPDSTKDLDIFSHSLKSLSEPRQHITGNVFEPLPFPDDSLALITSFDAWPYHFQRDDALHAPEADFGEITLRTLLGLYQKLAPGGKIVIFPWAIKRDSYDDVKDDTRVLEAVRTEFGTITGQITYSGQVAYATLRQFMSPIDLEVAENLSPIFDENHTYYEALIIDKPKQSSIRAAKNWAGKAAVSKETQDSPDPKQ